MLTYTALLIASLVVSAVVYFLYRVISDSSRSVYSSREHLALTDDVPARGHKPAGGEGVAYRPVAFGGNGHSSPSKFAGTFPAKPTETINWGWQGSGVQLQDPRSKPGLVAGHASHCSLYDANPAAREPGVRHVPSQGMLHREDINKATGKTYKVTRKTHSENNDDEDLHKPWGW